MILIRVTPRAGLKVVMPDRGRIASAAGETVDAEDPYYARAIADGDLVPAASDSNAPRAGDRSD